MDERLLEALAARAEQRAQAHSERKPFVIGGQKIACRKLTPAQQLEYFSAFVEASGPAALVDICVPLIYDSCPDLQDPALHKALGVTDPYDTVRRLMDLREIDRLGGQLMRWNGLLADDAAAEDTAKNS